MVLHGHSADGRVASQAAAHSSKVVSLASSFNIGPSCTPQQKMDLVRVIASELVPEQQKCAMRAGHYTTQGVSP